MTMQVATPQSEVYDKLAQLGWTLKKIQYRNGLYTAKASNETTGQEIERAGKSPEMALASVYQYAARAYEVRRYASLKKLGAWTSDWLDQKEEIAKAYSKLPPFDEKAVPAWKALAAESKVQADAIRGQITVQVSDDPEPYATAQEMCRDIHQNKHFIVSRANSEHPIWSVEDNVNFRIVHDVLGHCQSGGDFSWRGENLACGVHFPLVSPLAREALFVECIGQVAYYSFYRGYGGQKVGLLSQFLHPVQERNGEHVWVPHGGLPQLSPSPNENQGKDALDQAAGLQGIFNSPGQWVAPPNYVPSPAMAMQPAVMTGFGVQTSTDSQFAYFVEDVLDALGIKDKVWTTDDGKAIYNWLLEKTHGQIPERYTTSWGKGLRFTDDYEEFLKSYLQQLQDSQFVQRHQIGTGDLRNQYLNEYYNGLRPMAKTVSPDRQYDPNQFWEPPTQAPALTDPAHDYIGVTDTVNNAAKVDTEWQHEDPETQKRAIMNAFRVAILSPRKHIKWNAAHYQALMNADPATKAVDLWGMLEDERERHNQGLGYPEGSHLAYRKQLDFLAHELQTDNPELAMADALKEAKEVIFQKTKEFEEQLGADPAQAETSELKRYNMARKLVTEWLRENYTPARGWSPGQLALAGQKTADDDQPVLFEHDSEWKPIDMTGFANDEAKYGAFMGGHLDALAEVGQHIDQIRDAALEDIDQGGKGFIFRNSVMNMNLKGVNPKVASFAWLLLAPMTSELGIIDTHILRGLRRGEKDATPRDYYKLERMQRAAKDATGYSHMPLGVYHWGLWDQIRNPGEHSDHSALRVLDPLPWDSPDAKWDAASSAKAGPWVGPMEFENARGEMERAARDFDNEFAGQPIGRVPMVTPPGAPAPTNQSVYVL